MSDTKYIASFSGGKDSTATVILAHEHKEPLDLIGNIWNTLTKTSIHDKEEQFYWEDQQMTIFDFMKGSDSE